MHIDGSEAGDVLSVYDLHAFLESLGAAYVPDIESLRIVCRELESEGLLRGVGRRFSIADEGRLAFPD